jgi:Flp pilus assembly protein TadB
MSFALAGALAIALAVACAVLAPLARPPAALPGRHPDAHALEIAGWRRPLVQWEAVRVFCVVVLAAIALATGLPLLAAAAAGAIVPSLLARSRAESASRGGRLATTRLLRTTEAVLRSGGGLPEALRRATDASDNRLARRPFVDALRAFDLGAPLDDALRASAATAREARTKIALETLALGVGSRLPGERAGALVSAVADRLAFQERLDEEVRARTAGLRSQVLLLALIVPSIAAYLALTVPSLAETLAGPLGRTILVPAAIALEVVGIVASRRAVEGAVR